MKFLCFLFYAVATALAVRGLYAQDAENDEYAAKYAVIAPEAERLPVNQSAAVTEGTVTDCGDGWARLEADVHLITAAPMGNLVAALRNVAGQPGIFRGAVSKTLSAEVLWERSHTVRAVITTSTLGNKVWYTADFTVREDTPNRFVLTARQAGATDTCRKVDAVWFITELAIDGVPYRYIRFHDTNEVPAGAVKRRIIKAGLDNAHQNSLDQLAAAARNMP